MYQLGLSVSPMLGGLFSRGVDSAPHSRENGWSPGCPVPCSNQIKIIANKTPPGLLLVRGTRCFGQAMECDCWWRGSKISLCLGTAYNVSSMEDIGNSWSLCWQWKHTSQNYFHLCFSFELWHLCKSLLPSAKGLSFNFIRALAPLQIPPSLCEGPIF